MMKVVELDNIIAALVSGLAAVLAVIITGIFNSRKLSNEFKASSRESAERLREPTIRSPKLRISER